MWNKIVQIWVGLTEPIDSVIGHEARQKARFMAALYVIMLPLGAVMLIWGLASASPGNITSDNDFLVMLPAAFIWLACYILSKRGKYELATLISVGVAFIGIFLSNVLDTNPAIAEMSFLIFPILLSSMMLDYRISGILVGLGLFLAAIFPFINSKISFHDVLAGPITFLLIGSAMILISNYHRDRLERVRRQELGEYQDRARKLLASSYEGMFVVDSDTIIEANYAFASMLGYTPEELIGKKVQDLSPPELRLKSGCKLRDLLEITNEVIAIRRDGSQVHLELLPQQEESEGYLVDVVAVRDITERKEAENALQREKDRAQSYLQVAEVMFLALDRYGNITMINKKGCEILECREEEVIGENWFEIFLPTGTRQQVHENYERMMAGEIEPLEYYENPIATRTGRERIIAWHNSLLNDEKGNIIGALSSGEDITERLRNERKLSRNEARYRAVVEDQIDLINRCTLDGTFTFVNEAYAIFHGKQVGELVGKNYRDLFEGEVLDDVLGSLSSLSVDNPVRTDPPVQIVRDEKVTWLQWSSKLILDDAGEPIEYQSIGRDITALKLADKAMHDSEARYRAVIEDQDDLINRYDLDGTITFVNDAFADFFGIDSHQIIGKTHEIIHSKDQFDALQRILRQLSPQKPVFTNEVNHEFPDGRSIWILWTTRLVLDENGDPLEYQGVGTDITYLKLVQEALRKKEQDYRAVFEGAHDAIVIITPDDEIVLEANQRACDMYGFSREEFIGKSMELVTKDVPRGKRYLADIFEKGKPYRFDSVHIDREGHEINIEVNGVRIEYQGQSAILGIIRDVTDQVEAQIATERRAREFESLYASSQATGRLLPHDELFRHIQQEATKFLSVDIFGVVLWHAEDRETEIGLLYEDGEYQTELKGLRLPVSKTGLVSWVVDNQQTLLLNDFEVECHEYTISHVTGDVPKSWLGVPILAGSQVLGVLTAQSSQRNAFAPAAQKYLELLGTQLGTALENNRLFAAEQAQARELQRTNELVKALSFVSAQMVATEAPDQVFVTLGRELKSLGMTCGFISVDKSSGTARIEYLSSDTKALHAVGKLGNISLIGHEIPEERWPPEALEAIQKGQPVFSHDYAGSLAHIFRNFDSALVSQALKLVQKSSETRGIYLPLIIDDGCSGLLNISGEKLRETDLPAFTVFAGQVSSVLEKARLHEAERQQAAELETFERTCQCP